MRAWQLFNEMLQQELEPKLITYTAVVSALESAGSQRGPFSSSMRCRSRTRAQLITYTAVVGAWRCRMPERPLQLFNELHSRDSSPI